MDYTKLIIAFAILWFVQGYLGILQNKSMSKRLATLQREFTSGYLGVGIKKAKWNLGKGFFIILVIDENSTVLDFEELSGFTVISRFKKMDKYTGLTLKEARSNIKNKNMLAAFDEALSRINLERTHSKLEPFVV